ncbi:GAF domain-containing protein (plasmid) [Rathayibacter sp. VKM Ac-2759]|uniref:GAF and ANTAR domain-containing protein n=1 Tax=Rathayibacter sp. VKM Ac-2759 TaxID=2609252 RepID=UPI00131825CF|nr:GAF and ANTAR domain-containing protein [Rathayibacter sp. VKM Ac-2759]QHC68876.1 GAF domain-containing protein [Rathayibacter sp. VKM Ac-2759]
MAGSVREVRLAEVFVALARSLEPDHDVIDTMDVLVQAATQFTSAADAGIVLADEDGTLHVLASTSERASDVEEEQLGVREGPCLESYRTGEPVDLPDLADTDRWPAFTHVALEQGFRSAHATPLRLGSRTLGALNVFSENYGSLSAGEIALLQAFTDVAALALVHSENLQQQNDLAAQLRHALDSRVLIEQAKGVIAERNSISIDRAFALIRAHARANSARLHDVAHRIVTTTTSL